MKLYYGHEEAFLYPATHNFGAEADGASGTDIDFIDGLNLYDGDCRIIPIAWAHRKVLRLQDDVTGGEDPYIYHDETQATSGDRELWIATSDVTEDWQFGWYEVGPGYIIRLRINASKFQYYDSGDAWQDVGSAAANSTWYHLRATWRADNTFDLYVNGTLKVDNQATNNNQVSGVERFYLRGYGDSEDYIYLDAYGDPDNDTSYAIGDNVHWRHYMESTDSFEDDDAGTQGTSITWVDVVDTAASFEIVPEFNEHKKVLRGYYSSAAGGFDYCRHETGDRSTAGWFSCWIKAEDAGDASGVEVYLLDDSAVFYPVYIRLANDKFQWYTAAAWADSGATALDDTWYYILIQWYADNTFDFWVNNVQYGDGIANANNQDSGIHEFRIWFYDADGYAYIDAPLSSLDSDTLYENLEMESTEYDLIRVADMVGWTQITNIVSYPQIDEVVDAVGINTTILRDYEGANFAAWKERDFYPIIILDDDDYVLFRGYILEKEFSAQEIKLTSYGLGVRLERKHFDRDYRMLLDTGEREGYVKVVNANSTLDMKDVDGNDFTWVVDQWHTDQTLGLVISDNTNDLSSESWTAGDNPATTLGTEVGGDKDSLDSANDGDVYEASETGKTWDCVVTCSNLTGVAIANTNALNKIIINYRIGLKAENMPGMKIWKLQIWKDGTGWKTIETFFVHNALNSYLWYADSVSLEAEDDEADEQLQCYVDENAGDYVNLNDIRFVFESTDSMGTAYVSIDLLTADIYYYSAEISPIMEVITDSAASTITCSGVADWTATGVKADDKFMIGQNTITIAREVGAACQVAIDILGQTVSGGGTDTIRPNGDDTVEWSHEGGGDHYEDVDDAVTDPTAGDGTDIYTSTAGAEEIFDMGTIAMGGGGNVVTSLELHIYGKTTNLWHFVHIDIWTPTTGWLGLKYPTLIVDTYGWSTVTWSNLSLSQGDLDNLQVKLTYEEVFATAEAAYVDAFYISITYGVYSPFDKFIARQFKGTYGIDALRAVCKIEGAHWIEDYPNNRIKLIKPIVFEDSGVSLTENDYDFDWSYKDECNQVRRVDVWGNAANEIHEWSEDTTVAGFNEKQVIDDTITTKADAKTIADTLLENWSTKRSSLRLSLNGTYPGIRPGTYVNITMARPTVAATDYKIRRVERSKRGKSGIKTVIYAGMGETPLKEKIGRVIKDIGYMAHKALTDRLL